MGTICLPERSRHHGGPADIAPSSIGHLMSLSLNNLNAALNLEGTELPGGWSVGPLNRRQPEATGGMSSVSYVVTNRDGRKGFLKVVDLITAIGDINQLQAIINEYISERDLVVLCGQRRLSRVVTAIDHGQITIPGYLLGNVNYIIFELASSDVRIALSQSDGIDLVLRLEMFHQVTSGVRQLHNLQVAHQDLKPSNFLVFREVEKRSSGKLADLGRAYREGVPSLHDSILRPGDKSYAPPEQLYREEYSDPFVRRYAADLYQLGNLGCFIFGAVTMNALLSKRLAPEHHWDSFGDRYLDVLPYVTEAYADALAQLEWDLPGEIAAPISRIIGYLCHPDPSQRGHPKNRRGSLSAFSLERVVTEIDLLAKRTAMNLAKTK